MAGKVNLCGSGNFVINIHGNKNSCIYKVHDALICRATGKGA